MIENNVFSYSSRKNAGSLLNPPTNTCLHAHITYRIGLFVVAMARVRLVTCSVFTSASTSVAGMSASTEMRAGASVWIVMLR